MERCIYNKVERRPLILLFARRGREYSRSVNFEEEKKKISLCLDHCDKIVERCIYNKVERIPLILLFARRGRILEEYKFWGKNCGSL